MISEISEVPHVPQALLDAKGQERVVPFIGAGLSQAVVREGEEPPPSYLGFLSGLVKRADSQYLNEADKASLFAQIDAGDIREASGEFRRKIPEPEFCRLVRRVFTDVDPQPSQHHVIMNLQRFRLYLTTNYDRILDQVVRPRAEVLTYRDISTLQVLLDDGLLKQHSGTLAPPVIVKLNGDVSVPSTIALGQSEILGMWDADDPLGLGRLFRSLMTETSLLFLGYSFEDKDYRQFLASIGRELGDTCQRHFAAIPVSDLERLGKEEIHSLENDANFEFLPYKLCAEEGKNPHRGLWQFLSQIAPSQPLTLEANYREGSFYLPVQRPEYLAVQNNFEQTCHGLRYITPTLMNALATEEYIDCIARDQLRAKYEPYFQPSEWAQWLNAVVARMKDRISTIDSAIARGTELRLICYLEKFQEEINQREPVVLTRYRKVLDYLDDDNADVEIRFLSVQPSTRQSVTSYASLVRAHDTGSDIGVAYATQATTTDFETHVIEKNTDFAESMLVLFEREWVRALNEATTRTIIKEALDSW
ncbi:MAG: SIR2 family protein [Pseudomonadota bacterium]